MFESITETPFQTTLGSAVEANLNYKTFTAYLWYQISIRIYPASFYVSVKKSGNKRKCRKVTGKYSLGETKWEVEGNGKDKCKAKDEGKGNCKSEKQKRTERQSERKVKAQKDRERERRRETNRCLYPCVFVRVRR